MAAVLVAGRGRSQPLSAAALWGIGPGARGRSTSASGAVAARHGRGFKDQDSTASVGARRHRAPWNRGHRRRPRTLIDIATELPRTARAGGQRGRQARPDRSRELARPRRPRGEPGVKPLRTLLDRHTFRLSDTDSKSSSARSRPGRPPTPLTKAPPQRLRGRLLLARPRPRRRDRRLPLPPHPAAQTRDAPPRPDTRPPASLRCASPTTRSSTIPLRPLDPHPTVADLKREALNRWAESAGLAGVLGLAEPVRPGSCAPVAWSTLWTTSAGLATPTKTKL